MEGDSEDDPEAATWEPETGVSRTEAFQQYQAAHLPAGAAAAVAEGGSAPSPSSSDR